LLHFNSELTALPKRSTSTPEARLPKILIAEFNQGGYKNMMLTAYEVEAGMVLPNMKNRSRWLVDALRSVQKQINLTETQKATLEMYRDGLRRGR
jgi:hypothetical protein